MTALTAADAYELWADTYDSDPNPLLSLEARSLRPILSKLNPRQVIDVGCGTGRWLSDLAARGTNVIGVDASLKMLHQANHHPRLSGRLAVAHGNQLPFADGSADLVLCCMTLGYCPDAGTVIRELSRVAKPGARLILTDLHPEASAAGWTRSFRANGVKYNIEHWPHPLASIGRIAENADLILEHEADLYFGDTDRSVFQLSGKGNLFHAVIATPALHLNIWRKAC